MGNIGLLLLIQLVLLMLNAIFACAEIAMLSANETRMHKLAEEGNKRAKRLCKLTDQPEHFLAAIQVAITLSGLLGSAFAAENFSDPLVDWLIGLGVNIPRSTLNTIAVIFITLILSYVTLIFGELVPKRVAMKKADALSLRISGIVGGISTVFAPVVWLLSVSTNLVLRLFGIDPNEEEEKVGEEEIRMMVDAGSEKGTIDRDEQEFIQNVFEFDDLTAGEIATHRTDVVILWMEDSDKEWEETIHNSRYTLYPICDDSPDNVVGILNAKDYFRQTDKSRRNILATSVKPAYFVPETIKADVLFRNMRNNRYTLSVVLDEYGGMVGIVTLNDLLERLVGDLSGDPEHQDENEPAIERLDERTWYLKGNVMLRDMEEEVGVEFDDDEEFDTLTGFVFDRLGIVPNDGNQSIEIQVNDCAIHVKRIEDHQIVESTIRKLEEEPEPEQDD